MQLRNILLAATIVALPATLHAQPVNGWYIGAGIGVNDLLDSSVNKPSAGVGNKLTSNLGGALVGSVGYGYANGLRTELELNGRTQKSHFKIPAGASGNSSTYGAMVNVLYDIDVGGGVYPYLGAGLGYEMMNVKGLGTSKGEPAAQGILGLALPIGDVPGLSVTAEARVLGDLSNAKFGNNNNLANPTNVSGLIGLRYAFGAPVAPAAAPAPAPVPAPKAEEARTYLVFFDWDKADLTAAARQIIGNAAAASQRLAVTKIDVAGHADKSGTPAYNQALAMRRGQAVAAELVRLGVKKEAIMVTSFGDTKPLVQTAPGAREPQNRRVEIVLK